MIKRVLNFLIITLLMFSYNISVFAITDEEADVYNNLYYPQAVYNGGINTAPLTDTQEAYVNPATGSTHLKVADLTLPGANGFDLEITRIYNSSNAYLFEAYLKETDKPYVQPYYMIKGKKRKQSYDISQGELAPQVTDVCLAPVFLIISTKKRMCG